MAYEEQENGIRHLQWQKVFTMQLAVGIGMTHFYQTGYFKLIELIPSGFYWLECYSTFY